MPAQTVRRAKLVAIVTGLLGLILALATPLMPVKQSTAEITWPQPQATDGQIGSVAAPLISYVPIDLDISIPCSAVDKLPPGGSVLLSTTPKQAPKGPERGLFIRVTGNSDAGPAGRSVEVVNRNVSLASASLAQLQAQGCREIVVHADADAVTAEFLGMHNDDGKPLTGSTATRSEYADFPDQRPQLTGLFTDLTGPASTLPELHAHVTIDSRYSTAPTLFKWLAVIIGVIAALISLAALAVLDSTDGRKHRRFLPARWWHLNARDYVVIAALAVWHLIGPNTSDDGYLLTMSRVAQHADYTANYFRWYGAPEAPFGWYYEVFGLLSRVSVASPWMRLPALACGILVWLIVSHEVLPRLGRAAITRPAVAWTAAFVFLASWFPFNNGLRPEPIICLGALLTWCSVERAIATGRLLPAATACMIGAFSLAAGPTGVLTIAALIAGARPMVMALIKRARVLGGGWSSYAALLAPILAAGTFVIFVVFHNLTLRAFVEASAMKSDLGPSLHWYSEIDRYTALFTFYADGSIARRFAVLSMILSIVVCAAMLIRKSRIPGTALGPSRRIVGITFASLVFMMFTPTKWTHHFGVFAGLAAALAAIAAIAATNTAMHSRRNRTLFGALVVFVTAISFTAPNQYYYYSSWGMPWSFSQVTINGAAVGDILLYVALALLVLAGWFHFREPFTGVDPEHDPGHQTTAPDRSRLHRMRRSLAAAPMAWIAAVVVVFEIVTAGVAAIHQGSTAFSTPRSGLEALRGNACGMADFVWVEKDPNRDMLTAVDSTVPDPLRGPTEGLDSAKSRGTTGFNPNGIPDDLSSVAPDGALGVLSGDAWIDPDVLHTNAGGTGGGQTTTAGVNGSYAKLPFFLDPATTPVLGSYSKTDQVPAQLTSAWYRLPAGWHDRPLLTMSVAGEYDNANLRVQFTTDKLGPHVRDQDLTPTSDAELIDPGPRPSWRNLRYATSDIPADATAIRIVAIDDNLSEDRFMVITPPRIPEMTTLQDVVGSDVPTHVDWTSGLAFPCQRPFNHDVGVAEIPEWHIKPGADSTPVVTAWQNNIGGGPIGWLQVSQQATAMATYLRGDIGRDWGDLERYQPYGDVRALAEIEVGTANRSGLWSPGPIRR